MSAPSDNDCSAWFQNVWTNTSQQLLNMWMDLQTLVAFSSSICFGALERQTAWKEAVKSRSVPENAADWQLLPCVADPADTVGLWPLCQLLQRTAADSACHPAGAFYVSCRFIQFTGLSYNSIYHMTLMSEWWAISILDIIRTIDECIKCDGYGQKSSFVEHVKHSCWVSTHNRNNWIFELNISYIVCPPINTCYCHFLM